MPDIFVRPRSTDASRQPLTTPVCYRSSADLGWHDLVAQAFLEPSALDGWEVAPSQDLTLILFAGGTIRFGHRSSAAIWDERLVSAGDLILRSGEQSYAEVRWASVSTQPTRTLHLRVSGQLIARTAAELIKGDSTHTTLVPRVGFQDPLLAQIGFALWRELEEGSTTGPLYAQSAAQLLVVHVLQHYTVGGRAIGEPAQPLTSAQMNRVAEFVQTHLCHDLSLAVLAEQTGFSPYHFARLFRQATGESPHKYVMRQRIAHAARLLVAGKLPLAQIALECGFANQSHFTQAFRRQLGCTPGVFQREHANGAGM